MKTEYIRVLASVGQRDTDFFAEVLALVLKEGASVQATHNDNTYLVYPSDLNDLMHRCQIVAEGRPIKGPRAEIAEIAAHQEQERRKHGS